MSGRFAFKKAARSALFAQSSSKPETNSLFADWVAGVWDTVKSLYIVALMVAWHEAGKPDDVEWGEVIGAGNVTAGELKRNQ